MDMTGLDYARVREGTQPPTLYPDYASTVNKRLEEHGFTTKDQNSLS